MLEEAKKKADRDFDPGLNLAEEKENPSPNDHDFDPGKTRTRSNSPKKNLGDLSADSLQKKLPKEKSDEK